MKDDLSIFYQFENDVQLMLMMLESLWKLKDATDENSRDRSKAIQLKYKQLLQNLRQKLVKIKNPQLFLEYLVEHEKSSPLNSDSPTYPKLYKKLDIDFSVIIKKIVQSHPLPVSNSTSDINLHGESKMSGNMNTIDKAEHIPDHFTKQDLLNLVRRNKNDFQQKSFQHRKEGKTILANMVKVIRAYDPQKISDKIDNHIKEHPDTLSNKLIK